MLDFRNSISPNLTTNMYCIRKYLERGVERDQHTAIIFHFVNKKTKKNTAYFELLFLKIIIINFFLLLLSK